MPDSGRPICAYIGSSVGLKYLDTAIWQKPAIHCDLDQPTSSCSESKSCKASKSNRVLPILYHKYTVQKRDTAQRPHMSSWDNALPKTSPMQTAAKIIWLGVSVRNLGVQLDEEPTMKQRVNKVAVGCFLSSSSPLSTKTTPWT